MTTTDDTKRQRKQRSDKGKPRKPPKPKKRGRPKLDGRARFARTKEGKENRSKAWRHTEEVMMGLREKKPEYTKWTDWRTLYPDLNEASQMYLQEERDALNNGEFDHPLFHYVTPHDVDLNAVGHIIALDIELNFPPKKPEPGSYAADMQERYPDSPIWGRGAAWRYSAEGKAYVEQKRQEREALKREEERQEDMRDDRCKGCCCGMPSNPLFHLGPAKPSKKKPHKLPTEAQFEDQIKYWNDGKLPKYRRWVQFDEKTGKWITKHKNPQAHLPVVYPGDSYMTDWKAARDEEWDREAKRDARKANQAIPFCLSRSWRDDVAVRQRIKPRHDPTSRHHEADE
jgi:hypothetical protein